jgi:hypothetical protein
MCHCKTCADRLHVITVITAIAIPYSLASCLISFFRFYTHAFRSLLHVFYAYPIVHDTYSKKAKLSSATKSFPWRHTNIKNRGYNAVVDDTRRQPFCAEDSAPAPDEEGQKLVNVEHFWTVHTLRSLPDQGEAVCKVWLRSVQKCKFV